MINKRIGRIVAALGAAAVAVGVMGAATPALAASASATSTTWAGYVAQPSKHILSVDVGFTIPKNFSCIGVMGHYRANTDMWVGIGGFNPPVGSYLEQAGVSVTCASAKSKPQIAPFWESIPAVKKGAKEPAGSEPHVFKPEPLLHPGDRVSVEVDAPARSEKPGYWEFWVDVNGSDSPLVAYWKAPRNQQVKNTAEAITEWPGGNFPASTAAGLPICPVTYTGASYTTSAPGDEGNPIAHGTKIILTHTDTVTHRVGPVHWTQKVQRNVIVPSAPTDDGYQFTNSFTGFF